MQAYVLLAMIVVTTFEFLTTGDKWARFAFLPGPFKFVPEMMTALLIVVIVVQGARTRFRDVAPKYWIAFVVALLAMIFGVLINDVAAGPVVAGIRTYVRAVPWFFIGAIVAFSGAQLRTQFKLLLFLSLLQVPIAIEQRIKTTDNFMGWVAVTGDWTTGTFPTSGALSSFLVCAIVMAVAFYERKQLSLRSMLFIFIALVVPVSINETKVTLVLLPIGLLAAFLCAAEPGKRLKRVMVGATLIVAFGAVFVPLYDWLNQDREYAQSIGEFLSDTDSVERYMYSGKDVGSQTEVGRVDAIAVPMQRVAANPVSMMFGFGLGNVSDSALGPKFSGQHSDIYKYFVTTTFSRTVLELGWMGVLFSLVFFLMVAADARWLSANDDDIYGALAAGWVGVTVIMIICYFYTTLEVYPGLSFLYWYFAGLIAAQRFRTEAIQAPNPGAFGRQLAPRSEGA